MRLSLSKLGVAIGSAAVALTAAAWVASADPVTDTTCNYGQVMAAVNDPAVTPPATAAQFNQSPMAQSYLRKFLAAPPAKRVQMEQEIQAMPQAAGFMGAIQNIASVCNNYPG